MARRRRTRWTRAGAGGAILVALAALGAACTDDAISPFEDALNLVKLARVRASAIAHGKIERKDDARLFSEVSFAATHNSYSGADVGSIKTQLERGIRLLELDVHDDDYTHFGYRIGHGDVGDNVFHGDGNPASNALRDWMATIADWSHAHPDHAPITLLLDLKDALAGNTSFREGDLAALNDELKRAFGAKLFPAQAVEAKGWPSIAELRGRILTVLSGDERTRVAYRVDNGAHPAVAINDSGQVVEVHDSGDGTLWYWTGEYSGGDVVWHRHARYDDGQSPAVDINNDGLIVEVHESPDLNDYQLWYRVGHLGPDFEIDWFHTGGLSFPNGDNGLKPSLRFVAKDKNEVREVHKSPLNGKHWYWNGRFEPELSVVVWSRSGESGGQTSDPLFPKDAAKANGHAIAVMNGADGPFGRDTLLCTVDGLRPRRIRPPQLAFVEAQHESARELLEDGLFFYAGPASQAAVRSWAVARRTAGHIARLWRFNGSRLTLDSSVSFPATDRPFDAWYDEYCKILGCVR